MKLVVDINLSPAWCAVLDAAGHTSVHWSEIGDTRAADDVIMQWARDHGYAVFTHDLDFGAILWATKANGPSVIQLRGDEVLPKVAGALVVASLAQFADALRSGALLVIDRLNSRIRFLPLG